METDMMTNFGKSPFSNKTSGISFISSTCGDAIKIKRKEKIK